MCVWGRELRLKVPLDDWLQVGKKRGRYCVTGVRTMVTARGKKNTLYPLGDRGD